MYGCTQKAKIYAYKALVRPYLEYACAVWVPYTAYDTDLLESVQNRASHWIKSFWDPSAFQCFKSSAIRVGELGWPSLKVHCNFHLETLLYLNCH